MKFSEAVNGAEAIIEFLGPTKTPVPSHKAKARASVCRDCPKNRTAAGWLDKVSNSIASAARAYFRIKKDLNLKVPGESYLGLCSACDCPLRLKIHMPIGHIVEYTGERTMARLDSRCWILKEMNECL